MPEMMQVDRQVLTDLCGGAIPPDTLAKYFRFQKEVHQRLGGRPMDIGMLLYIADSTGALTAPLSEPHACDSWPRGCYCVAVDFDTGTEIVQGTFGGIEADGMVVVLVQGREGHGLRFNAKQVRKLEITPHWAQTMPVELPPEPEQRRSVRNEEDEPKQSRAQYLQEKLLNHPMRQIPRGTKMIVAVPGTPQCNGWFEEVDPQTAHLIVVRWPSGQTRAIDKRFAGVVNDEDGRPLVDPDGFTAAGGVLPPPPELEAVPEDEESDDEDAEDGTDLADEGDADEIAAEFDPEKPNWDAVAEGTKVEVRFPGKDPKTVKGWFIRRASKARLRLRLFVRGPREQRDKDILERNVSLVLADGQPVVDMEGFIAAGPQPKMEAAAS